MTYLLKKIIFSKTIDDIKQDDDSFEDTNISEEGTDIFEEESVPNVTEHIRTSLTDDEEYDTESNITDDELDNKSSISDNTSENQAATEPDEFNELDDELNDDTFDNIEVNNDSLNSNKYNSEKDSAIVEEHFSFLKKASDKSAVNTSTEDTDFLDDELNEI